MLIVLLLAGCKHAAVGISNAHPVAPAGGLQVNAVAPVPGPNYSMFSDWTARPVPPMATEREVGLQDCTKPIDLSAGNLRCR